MLIHTLTIFCLVWRVRVVYHRLFNRYIYISLYIYTHIIAAIVTVIGVVVGLRNGVFCVLAW